MHSPNSSTAEVEGSGSARASCRQPCRHTTAGQTSWGLTPVGGSGGSTCQLSQTLQAQNRGTGSLLWWNAMAAAACLAPLTLPGAVTNPAHKQERSRADRWMFYTSGCSSMAATMCMTLMCPTAAAVAHLFGGHRGSVTHQPSTQPPCYNVRPCKCAVSTAGMRAASSTSAARWAGSTQTNLCTAAVRQAMLSNL